MDSATILFFKCQKRDYNSFIIQFFGRDCQSWHGITFAHCARAIMVRPLLLHIHVVRFACKTKKPGLRHLLNPKIPTSRRNAVFFCQIFLKYMLCGVVFCAIIKYEDLV